MRKAIITDIIAFLLIILFLYAATSKLIDYPIFRLQLGQSPMLTGMASWIAWFIPLIEIATVFLLVKERFRLKGLFAACSIMTLFSAYIIAITRFSEFIPCSCGGILQKLSWNQHLIFNLCFLALSIAGIFLYTPQQDKKISPA